MLNPQLNTNQKKQNQDLCRTNRTGVGSVEMRAKERSEQHTPNSRYKYMQTQELHAGRFLRLLQCTPARKGYRLTLLFVIWTLGQLVSSQWKG